MSNETQNKDKSIPQCLHGLTHGTAIWEILGTFFEDWMDDQDKLDVIDVFCVKTGTTLQQLDDMVEQGIKNGYTVERQVELCKAARQALEFNKK